MTNAAYDDESIRLLKDFEQGDDEAAEKIFARYVERLVGLAHGRMSEKLGRRLDPEDVVQSVYRSFFCRARDGHYIIERSGDLWALLASMTVHKVAGAAQHHTQQKRSMNKDAGVNDWSVYATRFAPRFAAEPTEEDLVAVYEELESVMRDLTEPQRKILERRLQGATRQSIAEELEISERTVRRFLEKIKSTFENRLLDQND